MVSVDWVGGRANIHVVFFNRFNATAEFGIFCHYCSCSSPLGAGKGQYVLNTPALNSLISATANRAFKKSLLNADSARM